MKLDITKACADSLRTFTQNNYGIQLKSSHAHELVAAYFGYASRAALLADKKCPLSNLQDAEIIIMNTPTLFVEQRLKTLENLPSGLPSVDILAEGVYSPILIDDQLSGKIWAGIHEVAIAYAENRAFDNMRMMGMDQKELDWLTEVDIKPMETHVLIAVTFDYPAKAKKPMRYASVKITLPCIAGNIGYDKPEVMPTFYNGHMRDPDFRLRHGIDELWQ
ncbi:hypothetical protein GCM10007415_25250 [Parapedobacter pyrenivorans]|uniref:Uncharacterized protein n=1 Tax=Parapedobacter pyrenivorans TaxID=1305674 RepID=A0A917MD93_9SPHI|nr:hypothetical protein [Parapedobacter pyrenivorans]GGG89883.1 hypothetical protein GCM10007415_25250 [Parapedobacter pyrenivorans]